MRVSQRSMEDVREATNIVEVASEFTALRRVGARFTGLCPYPDHAEKTPSFSVSPEKGFYHCFGCLEANERIWTSRGLIPIAAAEIGDEVIGLDGRRETITDKWFRSDITVRIRTGAVKEGIELTPDHRCVFVRKHEAVRAVSGLHRRGKADERIRLSGRLRNRVADAKLSVASASEVRPGDLWLYPVIPDEDRCDPPLLGEGVIRPYTMGPRNERTTELPVNPATAWLYGLWLAEGSLYRGGVKWSLGIHESWTLATKVSRILGTEFGKRSTTTGRPEKNLCEVMCSSTDLSALFGHWFGRGCANKRVPIEALSWTPECQEALIRGYLDGDGSTQAGVTSAATVSEELAYGMFALCIQTRKVCSVNSSPARVGKDGVRRRKTYSLFVLCKESVKGFYAPLNGTTYYWSAVQEVERTPEKLVTVVDVTTTGSHSFLTKMGVTHNCQRGGDAVKLVMELKNLPFFEAVSHLAERFGVELELEGRSPEDERSYHQRTTRRRSAHKALAAATAYYHKYLLGSPAAEGARSYLQRRSIERSTIEEFRLGYAPPGGMGSFRRAAGKVGIGREALDVAGLVSPGGGERFFDRITFPISDPRGRIVGFGARALGEAKPKYLNSPETELFNKRSLLYGFPQVAEAVRREKYALVVEGYTDVLMLYQSGIKNAVATLGTAMTEQHLKTLSGYADKIYLLFDPDSAGEKAVEKAEGVAKLTLAATRLNTFLYVFRLSKDPADWLLDHPASEFYEFLNNAIPMVEYTIRSLAEQTRGQDAATRHRATPRILAYVREIGDKAPTLELEAKRLAADALQISAARLESLTASFSSGGDQREAPFPEADKTFRRDPDVTANPLVAAGQELLALMVARPDIASRPLREGVEAPALTGPLTLASDDFGDEAHARVFALLAEHPGEDLGAILSDERARPLLDTISVLQAAGERLYPSEVSLRAAWLRVGVLSRERSKAQAEDLDEKFRLHGEIKRLNRAAVEIGDLTLES